MNNYIDMNDVEQLIIDRLTGQIGDEEDSRLEQLIARHHEVEQLWQQMQQVYAMRKAVSFENSFNADAAWLALQQKVNIPDSPQQAETDTVAFPSHIRPASGRVRWMRYGIAAAVTGIIVVAVYILSDLYRQAPATDKNVQIKLANGQLVQASPGDKAGALMDKARQTNIDPAAWNTLTVPPGKIYSFTLADGTEVWLDAASELKFPLLFTGLRRHVELKGEGFFKVAHKAEQPFIVQVNGLKVSVLGTEFNIKSYVKESSYIALISGSVSVQNDKGEEIVLQPGEAIIADAGSNLLRKEKFDEVAVLGWMQGLYYFRNEKLHDITTIAERWFDVPVQLQEPELADLRFTGALNRNKPVNTFLDLLASSGNIRYEWKDGKIVLSRN
jgi:transmembrane sensor